MLPVGGYAAVDQDELPPPRRIPMLLAGPLANIAAGLPLMVAFRRYPVEMPSDGKRVGMAGFAGTLAALIRAAAQGPGSIARLAGSLNVGLGLANLLPVYPLDGGHVVMSMMEMRGVPQETRHRFARLTSVAFLLLARAAMLGDLRRLSAGVETRKRGTKNAVVSAFPRFRVPVSLSCRVRHRPHRNSGQRAAPPPHRGARGRPGRMGSVERGAWA